MGLTAIVFNYLEINAFEKTKQNKTDGQKQRRVKNNKNSPGIDPEK